MHKHSERSTIWKYRLSTPFLSLNYGLIYHLKIIPNRIYLNYMYEMHIASWLYIVELLKSEYWKCFCVKNNLVEYLIVTKAKFLSKSIFLCSFIINHENIETTKRVVWHESNSIPFHHATQTVTKRFPGQWRKWKPSS